MPDLDELEAKARAAKHRRATWETTGMQSQQLYEAVDELMAELHAACDPDTILDLIERVRAGTRAVWQFNEAVSLLREARGYLPEATGLAEEIDEGLPAIQAALQSLAHSPQEAV